MKQSILIIILLIQSGIVFGQQFLNFDFEKVSVEGHSRPWGWALDSWGTNAFSMDTIIVKSGKFSLKAHSESQTDILPSLQYNLEPQGISGKKITLKGYRWAALDKAKSSISFGYASVDAEYNYLDSTQIILETIESTADWQRFEVSFVIPENVFSVFVKIGMAGAGTIWYDDLSLSINEITYHELPVAAAFSADENKWIAANAQSFNKSPDEQYEYYGFDFLRSAIGNARIFAMGESTHGTSEFFKLKHHVFQYAVNELGFRVFALEDNQLACEKVNQYVLSKSNISAEEAMSGFFDVWYRAEMKELIEWIKKRNITNPDDPIYFAGYDMQDFKLPLNALKASLAKKDTQLLNKMDGFESFATNVFSASDSLKQQWLDKTNNIYEAIKNISNKYNKNELQNINLLRQFTENVLKGHWSLYRDEAMAENIIWLANVKYPKEKIFVWAHDIHVSKSNHPNELHNLSNGIAMGHFLNKSLGENYKSFGLMTYSGSYLALKSYTNFVDKVNAPLYLAPIGSLEEALHQTAIQKEHEQLFLDFQRSPTWLNQPLPFRFVNHVNSDYGFWQRISLTHQFDGVFFIDHTSSSKSLESVIGN